MPLCTICLHTSLLLNIISLLTTRSYSINELFSMLLKTYSINELFSMLLKTFKCWGQWNFKEFVSNTTVHTLQKQWQLTVTVGVAAVLLVYITDAEKLNLLVIPEAVS